MHIDEIIRELTDKKSQNIPLFRQELIIRLSMWLRYPDDKSEIDAGNRNSAILCGISQYALQKFGDSTLISAENDVQQLVLRNISLKQVALIHSGEYFNLPNFDEDNYFESELDEYSYTADIVKFMLWYFPVQNGKLKIVDPRLNASLNKAFRFIAYDGFGRSYPRSWRNFIKHWSKYRNASVFLYLNEFHFSRNYLLNPLKANFALRVDRLAQDSEALIRLLGMAKYLTQIFFDKLHANARTGIGLPSFPEALESVPVPAIVLDASVAAAVQGFDLNASIEETLFQEDAENL